MALTITGAHCKLYVNGSPYGRVETFEFTETTAHRTVKVVDLMTPWELIPEGVQVTGSMSIYRIHQDGGVEGAGMKAAVPDLARQKYFSILLVDRFTDTVLFRADQCVVLSQTWRAQKGLLKGAVSLQARTWSNEVEATSPTAR
jgi:hypothetical protein